MTTALTDWLSIAIVNVLPGIIAGAGLAFFAGIGGVLRKHTSLGGVAVLAFCAAAFLGLASVPLEGADGFKWASAWRIFGAVFSAMVLGAIMFTEKQRVADERSPYAMSDCDDDEYEEEEISGKKR